MLSRNAPARLIALIGLVAIPRIAAADDAGRTADLESWQHTEPEKGWATPRKLVDADRWDLGGTLIPSLQVPILVTDPFATSNMGGSSAIATGYGLEWRLGYAFGRLSIEGLGGFGRSSRDPVNLASGRPIELSLQRGWLGGQLRYTFTSAERVSPFIGAGCTAEYWSIDTIFRPNGKYVSADGVLTPAAHAMAGMLVRVVGISNVASVFAELGGKAAVAFASSVSGSSQVFLTPYLGLTVIGARPPLLGTSTEATEHAVP